MDFQLREGNRLQGSLLFFVRRHIGTLTTDHEKKIRVKIWGKFLLLG